MKRKIALVLMVMVLIGNMNILSAKNIQNDKQEKAESIKKSISTIQEFSIWSGEEINFDSEIYNTEGVAYLNLYSIANQYGIIGYVITDLDNTMVVEFALGESPYEEIFERDKKNIVKGNNKQNKSLVKEGPNYLLASENFDEIINVNTEDNDFFNNDPLDAVNRTEVEQPELGVLSEWQNVNMISGVPYELNDGTTPGCGPVSGINIIKYWDNKGYSNLVTTSDTKQSLYDELYGWMSSFKVPFSDGQVATSPLPYKSGLTLYFMSNGNYSITATTDSSVSVADLSKLKTEVNAKRPGTILYNDSGEYGLHYVTFVGYCKDSMNTDYYIIHDLWRITPVYRNWSYDVGIDHDIWFLYMFTPN